jgi:hypothetical protein
MAEPNDIIEGAQPVADTAFSALADTPTATEAALEGGANEAGGPAQTNRFEGPVQAEMLTFANIENQVVQLYETRTALRHFTCADGEAVSESWEEASERGFRGSDAEIDALLQHLEERRVLLLDAAPGAGRVTAAICLGRRLRSRGRCVRPTLLVQSLDRQVRIDVRQVASHDAQLRGRMVIFRDLLSRVERADRSDWAQMAEQLRERGAYLVFITDSSATAAPDDLSPTHGLVRALAPHPGELLESELKAWLEEMECRGSYAPELLASLREGREWLLQTFRFTPQLAEFVSLYTDLNQPGLALEEAWRRFHRAGTRLLRDRDGDLDGWSAVFALILAQCVRDARGARWVDFDGLHRRVRDWLRADVERRTPGKGESDGEAAPGAPPHFDDAPLLHAAHAETYPDPATRACGVRFRDGLAPEPLWQALLERHRGALLTILPGLRALAGQDGELSVLAAQVIGRMGEMDPERITIPLATRWLRAADPRQQRAVGPLFEGVLGSASEPYRAFCLQRLRAMRSGADGERLSAVIAAYSWIGDYELGHAMRDLGAIGREYLAPMIADLQRIQRLAEQVRHRMDDARSIRSRAALRSIHTRLRDAASAVYKEQGRTFLALQMSLNSLCATRGPLPVLAELRRWVAEGGWKMGVLVALLFLNEKGIADTLQKSRGEAWLPGAPGGACNPLVVWLAEGDDEVRQMAGFFRDLFESLATPFLVQTDLQRACATSLGEHLTDWMRDALPVSARAAAVRSLLETMARMPALREPVLDLLQSPALEEEDRQLRAFVASIRI